MKSFLKYYEQEIDAVETPDEKKSSKDKDWQFKTLNETLDNALNQGELAIKHLKDGEYARTKEAINGIIDKVVEVQQDLQAILGNG